MHWRGNKKVMFIDSCFDTCAINVQSSSIIMSHNVSYALHPSLFLFFTLTQQPDPEHLSVADMKLSWTQCTSFIVSNSLHALGIAGLLSSVTFWLLTDEKTMAKWWEVDLQILLWIYGQIYTVFFSLSCAVIGGQAWGFWLILSSMNNGQQIEGKNGNTN